MAEILKLGGTTFHPSAANTGNEAATLVRGMNMILRGSNGSYYFECYGGHKNLNEDLPMVEIQGTISYTAGSVTLVGTGTNFKNELRFGQKFIAGDPLQVFVAEDIFDAENMTVQRPPDANGTDELAYKIYHLFEIHNQRGTLIWGNAQKFDRGNFIAVGDGRLRLNGQPLQGESLIASRRLKIANFDPSTGDYTVDELGFSTPPDYLGVSVTVVAGGVKDMTQGFYSFRWAWADSRTGYGFSNPSEVIKLDASNNPIEITATNQRFRLDFTSGLSSQPVTADSIIVYRSLYSDPTQNVTQTGEGSWYTAKIIKIADLDPGDILYVDVLDGELGEEVSFDNDVPPEADWVSVLAGDPILISCYGDTVVGGGDRGSAPGPFVSPSRRGNRHGFPAALATVLSPPEQIIGFAPALGRLFLMTRVGLPFAASTGEAEFPVETRAFWTTRFKSPYGLVFFNDSFYAFTITGAMRAIGTADKAQEQIDFSDAVSDITREWSAGYVHAGYDPQNEMIVFIYSAAYRNDDGWWVSLALPYSLIHQCWMPLIEITKPNRDMIVSGVATVGSHLQFLAGGRGEVEEFSSEEPEESSEEPPEPSTNPVNPTSAMIVCSGNCRIVNTSSFVHLGTSGGMTTDDAITRGEGTNTLLFDGDGTHSVGGYFHQPSIGFGGGTYSGWQWAASRFSIYFETMPSGDVLLWQHSDAGGIAPPIYGIGYQASTGTLRLGAYGTFFGTFSWQATGISVTTGQWYDIDIGVDSVTAPPGVISVDAQVDGVALPNWSFGSFLEWVSGPGMNGLGPYRTQRYRIADIYTTPYYPAYPIGPGYVRRFNLAEDGTHNIGADGTFVRGAAGANITNATTDSYLLVDEIPIDDTTPDTDDYITQTQDSGGGSNYTEHIFSSPDGFVPPIPPMGVDIIVAKHSASAGNGFENCKIKLNDNGDEGSIMEATGGSASITYAKRNLPNPLTAPTGWSTVPGAGDFNNLRIRFGYSTDGDPDQSFDGAIMEAFFLGEEE